MVDFICDYFDEIIKIAHDLSTQQSKNIASIIQAIKVCADGNHTVFICGNGGSGSNASHFASDCSKLLQGKLKIKCLNDNMAFFSACANDIGYDQVFAYPMRTQAKPGDILICLSGSGLSENIINGLMVAKDYGLTTIGLTGFDGGLLAKFADFSVVVPSDNMQAIEDAHLSILHLIALALKDIIKS